MSSRRSARLIAASEVKASPAAAARLAAAMPPPPAAAKSRKRKASAVDESQANQTGRIPNAVASEPPTTPQKRRATKVPPPVTPPPPPATPTPDAAKLLGEPRVNGTTPLVARSKAVNRLANPRGTNAQLLSPETSRLVTPSSASLPESPTKLSQELSSATNGLVGSPSRATTTANILEEACAHLIKIDARMKPLIEKHHCRVFSPEGLAERIDPFESLCSGIISQQVSGAAAKAIKKRFVELFYPPQEEGQQTPDSTPARQRSFPHPSDVTAASIERLRSAGLSQRKAEYVQGLAQKFASGELSAQMLVDAPYEEMFEKLIAVRGLGKWSVEMFACFALKRMDVFSLGDLGIQRGMAAFVGRDVAKLKNKGGKWKYMSEQDMVEMSDRFKPYRSVFMWYMWRVEETDVSTME
ncbi:DNA glycosylase [Microdochium trichocladiopsis]|uniref:DNA glycosylase n=1 Tax=Microdochium trichocladiopsis TaxID=1682393 RepID=A0A9P8XZU2_9PEZI|nr:DNA glycosylase [Microdochium trichocladiopsis]KAH7025910.1 DNA glycosylase [Microdochium trichocladiopsis]